MNIKEIKDSTAWNEFVLAQKPNTFLHSWEWGQAQKQSGEDVRYLGVFDDNTHVAAVLLITVRAKRGTFYLIPHGPIAVPNANMKLVLDFVVAYCKQSAVQDSAVALRIAPLQEASERTAALFTAKGFRSSPLHVHAELTWLLDISKSEEELLAGMRKTTRHAVKKAEKVGVTVKIFPNSPENLDRFWPLYEATKTRHNFVPFPKSFIESQANEFSKENRMYFAIATHQGKDVASAMLIHFGDTVFYYHGASIKLPSSVPAAQLLQWESIREAKGRGATQYNFWGIAPDDEKNHPFAGITTFKKGFGGYAIDYIHAQDLPLSIGYWKLWAIDSYRKWRRGF